ncbi:MAG: glycoside hydrolase family 15 protein, partial [Candidatus Nanoarchaeia archaeon]
METTQQSIETDPLKKSPGEHVLNSIKVLTELRHHSGLFLASHNEVNTGYNKAWIRDNVYEAIGLEAVNPLLAIETYHALLDVLLKHEYKIDWAIKKKPKHTYQYIHARYHPETHEEFDEEWGNKQHDAVGLFLFKIGELHKKGYRVIRDDTDIRIVQKLADYLEAIEYWQNPDHGVWEMREEVHASSVGACVAGLQAVKGIVKVNAEAIEKGSKALNDLLPRESCTKEYDLAQLSLIFPFNIVNKEQAEMILKNIAKLEREKGLIRHHDDYYYNNGKEA